MPPKRAPKSASVPGPSDHGGESSRAMQPFEVLQVPEVPILKEDLPKFGNKYVSADLYTIAFASQHWFKPDGRLLIKEEVLGIICLCDPLGRNPNDSHGQLFKFLRDSEHRTTSLLDGLKEQEMESLTSQIEPVFRHYLRVNADAASTHNELRGFPGRLETIQWKGHTPLLDGHPVRDEQCHLINALCNLRTERDDRTIGKDQVLLIIKKHCGYNVKPNRSCLVDDLFVPTHQRTQKIAGYLREENQREFFRAKALQLCQKHLPEIAFTFQADYVPMKTLGFAEMTIGASASSAHQQTMSGPSQTTAQDTHGLNPDEIAKGFQPIRTQPPPSEPSSEESSGEEEEDESSGEEEEDESSGEEEEDESSGEEEEDESSGEEEEDVSSGEEEEDVSSGEEEGESSGKKKEEDPDFKDFIKWPTDDESQPTEAGPPHSGATHDDPRGKGKGRARDYSPGSPQGGDSGKGKQPQEKRQRRGGRR